MNDTGADTARLLAVDDEPSVLEAYRLVLSPPQAGSERGAALAELEARLFGETPQASLATPYDLALCGQADEAVAAVSQALADGRPFAVAFLDVRMPPGPDGVKAAELIRAADRDIQIVIVTGYSDVDPQEIARRVPPMDRLLYLQKPLHAHELRQLAAALTAKWRAERLARAAHRELEGLVAERTAQLQQANEQLQRDLAERRRVEAALRASEESYRTIFEAATDGICVHDGETGAVLDTNGRMGEMFGYSREEARRLDVGAFSADTPPCTQTDALARIRSAAGGEPQVFEWQARHRDGRLLWAEVSLQRAFIGNRDCVLAFVRDITERRKAEEAQRLAVVGQLAAGVAHEFNNLLSGMRGWAEMALESERPEHARKLAETALQTSLRGAEVCRNLLRFARPAEPKRSSILIEAPIEAALAVALQELERGQIEVTRQYRTEGIPVHADPAQLEQVFLNLLLNACHAMPEGGRLVIETAHIPHQGGPGEIVARVSDTGTGIRPEDLPRIFEPFFTTKGDGKGTGLGLATVQSIAERAGGTVSVWSEVGRGSRFTLTFPLAETP